MGLGFEKAAPDILQGSPHEGKTGTFKAEVMVDIFVYGLWMTILSLAAFMVVLFGFGNGDIGSHCNDTYSEECDTVFRARATTFVCLTWFALFLAWETTSPRRSFFRMKPGSTKYLTQWAYDVWSNQFLFWSVVCGLLSVIPTLYIPVINEKVFRHRGLGWEWGVVFVELAFFCAVWSSGNSAKDVTTEILRRQLIPWMFQAPPHLGYFRGILLEI